jgi:DNA-binding NarL/FixJ family response regulator
VKVLVIDDHPLVAEAMAHWLHQLADGVTLQSARNCAQGLAMAAQGGEPDIVLLDLNLPGLAGIAALRAWRTRFPAVPVVVLSADQQRDTMRAALDTGAAGFVPKSTSGELLLGALRVVLAGGRYLPPELLRSATSAEPATLGLTERQLQVLRLLASGAPNKTIGRELGLAERTVKAHVTAVMRALNVSSRTQAAVAAGRLGIVRP